MDSRDVDQDFESLLNEAKDILNHYHRITQEFTTWSTRIGPFRLARSVGTNGIFLAFLSWHLVALTSGIVITLAWANTRELGVALIVGALFGVGSFISQVWSQGMDREREFILRIEHEDTIERFRLVSKQMRDIERRLQGYTQDDD